MGEQPRYEGWPGFHRGETCQGWQTIGVISFQVCRQHQGVESPVQGCTTSAPSYRGTRRTGGSSTTVNLNELDHELAPTEDRIGVNSTSTPRGRAGHRPQVGWRPSRTSVPRTSVQPSAASSAQRTPSPHPMSKRSGRHASTQEPVLRQAKTETGGRCFPQLKSRPGFHDSCYRKPPLFCLDDRQRIFPVASTTRAPKKAESLRSKTLHPLASTTPARKVGQQVFGHLGVGGLSNAISIPSACE